MKRVSIAILCAALAACAHQPAGIELGQRFDLQAGANASVNASDKVTVKLLQVSGESRCPTDVQCVWAGDATVKLDISVGSQTHATVDLHTNAQSGPTSVSLAGYTIKLVDLTPYPKSTQPIQQKDYVAKLEITK